MNATRVFTDIRISLTATAALLLAAAAPQLCSAQPISITPGTSIQDVVNSYPENTAFLLKAGVHRLQSVAPKNGNNFIGEPGAIMSGAVVLTSFLREGSLYFAPDQTQGGLKSVGMCEPTHPRCLYTEDLYFDGQPLLHVANKADVKPGTWFFDYDADRIYFADDPNGHTVETSVAHYAFYGRASGVTIQGLIVEKYASPAQRGAIGGDDNAPKGWLIQNNEVRWNHGLGIRGGDGTNILQNNIHHNGQMGINIYGGSNQLVAGNEISFSNWAGYYAGWEAGGTKFVATNGLKVLNNYSHDNNGTGLWTDIDNVNTLYEGNRVINNTAAGISHEISYDCIIRNNLVQGNGRGNKWLWDGQIQIQNSQRCEVSYNTVSTSSAGGHGITLIYQNRGNGAYGPYDTSNNNVHDNHITYGAATSASGAVADTNNAAVFNQWNNRFDFNHYHAPDLNTRHWAWGDGWWTWNEMQGRGVEVNGTADTNIE